MGRKIGKRPMKIENSENVKLLKVTTDLPLHFLLSSIFNWFATKNHQNNLCTANFKMVWGVVGGEISRSPNSFDHHYQYNRWFNFQTFLQNFFGIQSQRYFPKSDFLTHQLTVYFDKIRLGSPI